MLFFVFFGRFNEDLNRDQLFSTNNQYVKIKLMQDETNRWTIFFIKGNKVLPIDLNYQNFHIFYHKGSVIFYREGVLLKIGGIRYFF